MYRKRIGNKEQGFTMVELLVAMAISVLMLALAVGVFTSQRETFTRQNVVGKMQANGRAAVDFLARGVQNSGFNVVRGTRFLAASDHYLTTVFDEDNDRVIQNDEVLTYAVSKPTGGATDTFTISPYFDMDGDGSVENSETRDYDIGLVLNGPPYYLYKIVPDAATNATDQYKVALDIENLVIRYYDKNDSPLPAGVAVDANGDPVPPYTLSSSDMNEIRRVEFYLQVRSHNTDPREAFTNSGSYVAGSVATLGGSNTFSDSFHRLEFAANAAPRNLVMAPWGKMEIIANPDPVTCPDTTTNVVASLVDNEGAAVPAGTTINFVAKDATLGASSGNTNSSGEVSNTLSYDWKSPTETITMSANALMDVSGETYPVFSAIPVAFQSDGMTDNFDDGMADGWTEGGSVSWTVTGGEYKTISPGLGHSVNGCHLWQDYTVQATLRAIGSMATDDYAGVIMRFQNDNEYYMARIYCTTCPGTHEIQIVKLDTTETILGQAPFTFVPGTDYNIKARLEGSEIQARIWEASGTEPTSWNVEVTDNSYASGKIGINTLTDLAVFDDVAVASID